MRLRHHLGLLPFVVACGSDGNAPSNDASALDADAADTHVDVDVDAAEAGLVDVLGQEGGVTFEWYPGHYVLVGQNSVAAQTTEISDMLTQETIPNTTTPFITPFAGIAAKYFWAAFETTQGDYSPGFAKIDADLAAVAAKNKKLVLFLNYKIFDNDQGVPSTAVPDYMTQSGSQWCVPSQPTVCGQYTMANGHTAMVWNGAVAARVHAWLTAVGNHVAASPLHSSVAGYILPETACSEGPVTFAQVGYTQTDYTQALEDNVTALHAADPAHPAFIYINFMPPNGTAAPYLKMLADFAKTTVGAGLGCPDVAPPPFQPLGYTELTSAAYQVVVPFNVAIETPDYDSTMSSGVAATYDVAINTMKAGQVTWVHAQKNASRSFGIDEVATYISSKPFPNTTPPSW